MGAKRKSYTPKYRQDAARVVIDTGRTVAEVAREIGVGEQLLGRWVAIARSRMGGRHWWEGDHSADIDPADGELSWIAFMLAIGFVVLTVLYLIFR